MATDMDTSNMSNKGSPPVITPVDTDEAMGHLVPKKIWEYCAKKRIDNHDQFQRIEVQCDSLLSMYTYQCL